MEKCSLLHAAMHVIHLIIFQDLALLMSLLNLHPKCCQNSFTISNAASISLDWEKGVENTKNIKKNKKRP